MAPNDWALCVGIGDYAAKSLPSLPGARKDAERFYAWVTSPTGGDVPVANCTLVVSPHPQDRRNPAPLAHQLEQWIKRLQRAALERLEQAGSLEIGRRLYVFLAGHGFAFGPERETGLLAADAQPPGASEHFAGRVWVDWLRNAAAFREVVLFMDCCRSELLRIEATKPPWQERLATDGRPARHFYGFSALAGAAAREIPNDGDPIGLFTRALLECLDDPSLRPLSASTLKGLLYQKLNPTGYAPVVLVPDNPADDFVLLPVIDDGAQRKTPPSWRWTDQDTLLVYDPASESAKLATAVRLAGGTTVPLTDLPTIPGPVGTLIVAADGLSDDAVKGMVAQLQPKQMILYSHGSFAAYPPPVAMTSIAAHETDSPALAMWRVKAAMEGRPTGRLYVMTRDDRTALQVWNDSGELLAQRTGDAQRHPLVLDGIPHATYRIHAMIGSTAVELEQRVDGETKLEMPLVPVRTPAPIAGNPLWSEEDRTWLAGHDPSAPLVVVQRAAAAGRLACVHAPPRKHGAWSSATFSSRRAVCELRIDQRTIAIAVPIAAGMRTEVYADGTDVAVRMVSTKLPVGSELPSDRIREILRQELGQPGPRRLTPPAAWELHDDPIAALIAMSVHHTPALDGPDWSALVAIVVRALGADDPDLRVWQEGFELTDPPLLAAGWGIADAAAGSTADGIVGREVVLGPWLAWDTGSERLQTAWLSTLASVMWPAWNRAPDATAPGQRLRLDAAAGTLRSPRSSIQRSAYKSPPLRALVAHERVAFVGASNDQLPSSLVIAFMERREKKWRELDAWFLEDGRLDLMTSDDRVGDVLRHARDRAEEELLRLLPLVAERWRVLRYDGLELRGLWHFASLWDWDVRGKGYVHVSAYRPGEDVRTAVAHDERWRAGADAPPANYAAGVAAYAQLSPTRVVGQG